MVDAVATPVPPLATGRMPVTPAPPVNGNPVPFVSTTDEGVPSAGITSVGEVERTTEPLPVEVVVPVPPCETVMGIVGVTELNVASPVVPLMA